MNSEPGLSGKVVIVTGGSRGIGAMIATGFVQAGATVYVSSRKAEACDEMAATLNDLGPGRAIALPADISVYDEAARAAADLLAPAIPGGDAWRQAFRHDLQHLLLAELDVRFLPIDGLLAALRNR